MKSISGDMADDRLAAGGEPGISAHRGMAPPRLWRPRRRNGAHGGFFANRAQPVQTFCGTGTEITVEDAQVAD